MEINIQQPSTILNTIHYVVKKTSKEFYRDGIALEKGAVITQKRIEKNYDLYTKYCGLWSVYPDLLNIGA